MLYSLYYTLDLVPRQLRYTDYMSQKRVLFSWSLRTGNTSVWELWLSDEGDYSSPYKKRICKGEAPAPLSQLCRRIPSSPQKFFSRGFWGAWACATYTSDGGQRKLSWKQLNLDFPAPAREWTSLWVLMSCPGLETGRDCGWLRTLKILLKNHLSCTLGWNALSSRGSKQTWQTFSH